jgi:hypothetical protein
MSGGDHAGADRRPLFNTLLALPPTSAGARVAETAPPVGAAPALAPMALTSECERHMFALFKMGGRPRTTQLGLAFRKHGGPRPGAGRKPRPGRRNVLHRARQRFASRHPLLVTLRSDAAVGSLRAKHTFREVRASIAAAAQGRAGFRIVQFSVQRDHIHLIVEAKDRATLSLAMRGLAVRLCKAINRAVGRPCGRVFLDRYHDRILRTPREVRHALAYVLQNARKHGAAPRSAPRAWVDPMSSGPWFDG